VGAILMRRNAATKNPLSGFRSANRRKWHGIIGDVCHIPHMHNGLFFDDITKFLWTYVGEI